MQDAMSFPPASAFSRNDDARSRSTGVLLSLVGDIEISVDLHRLTALNLDVLSENAFCIQAEMDVAFGFTLWGCLLDGSRQFLAPALGVLGRILLVFEGIGANSGKNSHFFSRK